MSLERVSPKKRPSSFPFYRNSVFAIYETLFSIYYYDQLRNFNNQWKLTEPIHKSLQNQILSLLSYGTYLYIGWGR